MVSTLASGKTIMFVFAVIAGHSFNVSFAPALSIIAANSSIGSLGITTTCCTIRMKFKPILAFITLSSMNICFASTLSIGLIADQAGGSLRVACTNYREFLINWMMFEKKNSTYSFLYDYRMESQSENQCIRYISALGCHTCSDIVRKHHIRRFRFHWDDNCRHLW